MKDDKLESLYDTYWQLNTEMLKQGHEPMAIAGVMVAQALTIYKTIMNEVEFDMMVDNIADSRDKIKKLETGPTLQ